MKEAKECEIANFDKFMVYKVVKDDKSHPFITSAHWYRTLPLKKQISKT